MLLSIYTYVKDGIFHDLHAVDMLKHHIPLADEIVVNEGYSSDGTYEKIRDLDPKIRIFRTHWPKPEGGLKVFWHIPLKDAPRRECKGEWCLHLDADEFIPEWDFQAIRDYIQTANEVMIPVKLINFYANYKVYHTDPAKVNWPARKMILHRNRPDIEFWGDGANIRLKDTPLDWNCSPREFTCHHFGTVRNPARLRQKWHTQANLYTTKRHWFSIPSFLFNWRPHDWRDPQFLDDLAIWEGSYVKAVRDNPDEFVRDDLQMYRFLQERDAQKAR